MRKRRYGRRGTRLKRALFLLAVVMLVTVSAVTYYNGRIKAIAETMALSRLQDIATAVINEVMLEITAEEPILYDQIVSFEKNGAGDITALNVDTSKLNALKSHITLKVNEKINGIEEVQIKIPLGSLMNVEMFAALGPKISIHMLPVGSTYGTVHQEFSEAGINQVRHRIYIRITVEAGLIMPNDTHSVSYFSDFVIADTVIVGVSPDFYADYTDSK